MPGPRELSEIIGGDAEWPLFESSSAEPSDVLERMAAAAGRHSETAVRVDRATSDRMQRMGLGWLLTGATWCELGRLCVLLRATDAAPRDAIPALLGGCFRLGDHGAKRAVLRVLSLMPDPLRLADVAALGCRSAAPTVFEAICCHNPYPTRHLPDLHFFPMLLKATFWAIPLDRVVELSTRLSPELGQMALQQAMA